LETTLAEEDWANEEDRIAREEIGLMVETGGIRRRERVSDRERKGR